RRRHPGEGARGGQVGEDPALAPGGPEGRADEAPGSAAAAVIELTHLPNGIRVLSERLPDLPSVTVGIWVENGSRYEQPEQAGISHFLEHLFFKGTQRRTAAQIAE